MTVSELMEKLALCPPEAEVVASDGMSIVDLEVVTVGPWTDVSYVYLQDELDVDDLDGL